MDGIHRADAPPPSLKFWPWVTLVVYTAFALAVAWQIIRFCLNPPLD